MWEGSVTLLRGDRDEGFSGRDGSPVLGLMPLIRNVHVGTSDDATTHPNGSMSPPVRDLVAIGTGKLVA
jgi:hypothetical protein